MTKLNLDNIIFENADMKRRIILPSEITCDLAEEVGIHIGDGSMNKYHKGFFYQLRGHINDDKEHYLTRITYLYKKLFNLRINIRNMPNTGVLGFQIWSHALVDFKHKILGLPLGKKINIDIPKIFLINEDFFISIIRGIFDTDGTLYLEHKNSKLYPRIEIRNISKILVDQLERNLLKFGFRATSYTYYRKEPNWNDIHVLSVRGDKMIKKWFEEIQPSNNKHVKKYYFYLNS